MNTPIIIQQYVICWTLSISSSFDGQLSQKSGWAGTEYFVRTHIIEPPF